MTPRKTCNTPCPYDADLVREMHAEQAVQHTKIETIGEGVQEIKNCLLGNGKPGLVLRMDRIEQKNKAVSRVLWSVFLIITTAAVGWFLT